MNVSDLLLSIKDISFDTLVQQTNIKTEEDKHAYLEKGYFSVLTEKEFIEKFDVDPSCIWYMPSFSQPCIYFNEDTLAVSYFPIDFLSSGMNSMLDGLYQVIKEQEKAVKNGKYQSSISCFPDAMRFDYINLLVEKHGSNIENLYELFFSNYTRSDYGFYNINPETLSVILDSKTENDKKKTESKLLDLPETITVYRGGNSASTPYDKAYSWTLDINVANFFACRRGSEEGYIVTGEIKKEDVIETFLGDNNEEEFFVNPNGINIISQINIKGIDYIESALPDISSIYSRYRDEMENLIFTQRSVAHGPEHQARVLLLALTIAEHLDLPLKDREVLATAAIYHDTQRVHDDTDELHGKASRDYYHNDVINPDPLVEFLCEYHCLPDEDGYKEILNNKELNIDSERAKLLIDIFKDADALDRVRFGIRDLDMNQLRLPISKELSLVARLYLENIKVDLNVKYTSNNLSEKISAAEKTVSKHINKSFSNEKER